ncbi:MAG TPA: TIGR03936 family radical SAM-associated protein [Anaerolineae bacterium]|nr:TIGR03936 family radical SAM-associated protein [Anaerolineae bacterium]
MQPNYVQRLRLHFSKAGVTRYIGHLDLARTLERSLNRAQLPIAYTQGFNPRPRMQFAAALPLGYTSQAELADIWLKEEIDPATAQEKLTTAIAPGLIIHDIYPVPLKTDALQNSTHSTLYAITFIDPSTVTDLAQRVQTILEADEVKRERRRKKKTVVYNLRPLIHDLKCLPPDDNPTLHAHLALRTGANGRPDELLMAMNIDPLETRIHRLEIYLQPEED